MLDHLCDIFPIQDWEDIALLSDNEMDKVASELATKSTDKAIEPAILQA